MRRPALLLLLALAACTKPAPPPPRQIRIVGGAAGFPIAAAVTERFMTLRPDAIAPLVQAGGDASAIARFCGGPGARHPDLALVARTPTQAERARCARNGVARITIVPIGWSATVAAMPPPASIRALTTTRLRAAIAGPAATWRAIDPALPDAPVRIEGVIDGTAGIAARKDGAFRVHGADAALAAAEAIRLPGHVAVLPYAAWWRQRDELAAIPLDGVAPDAAAIAAGRYPTRTPLLLFVKRGEASAVPGLPALLRLFVDGLGPQGALADAGLIERAPADRRATRCTLFEAAGDTPPPDCNNRTAMR